MNLVSLHNTYHTYHSDGLPCTGFNWNDMFKFDQVFWCGWNLNITWGLNVIYFQFPFNLNKQVDNTYRYSIRAIFRCLYIIILFMFDGFPKPINLLNINRLVWILFLFMFCRVCFRLFVGVCVCEGVWVCRGCGYVWVGCGGVCECTYQDNSENFMREFYLKKYICHFDDLLTKR